MQRKYMSKRVPDWKMSSKQKTRKIQDQKVFDQKFSEEFEIIKKLHNYVKLN